MVFSLSQVKVLQKISTDVAKGLFLASFVLPAVVNFSTIFNQIVTFVMAIIVTLFVLRLSDIIDAYELH